MVVGKNAGLAEIAAEIESLQALKKEKAKQARADLGEAVLKALAEDPDGNPMRDPDVSNLAREIREVDPAARRKKRGRKKARPAPEMPAQESEKKGAAAGAALPEKEEEGGGKSKRNSGADKFVRINENDL